MVWWDCFEIELSGFNALLQIKEGISQLLLWQRDCAGRKSSNSRRSLGGNYFHSPHSKRVRVGWKVNAKYNVVKNLPTDQGRGQGKVAAVRSTTLALPGSLQVFNST